MADVEFVSHDVLGKYIGIEVNWRRMAIGLTIEYPDCLAAWLVRLYVGPFKLWIKWKPP